MVIGNTLYQNCKVNLHHSCFFLLQNSLYFDQKLHKIQESNRTICKSNQYHILTLYVCDDVKEHKMATFLFISSAMSDVRFVFLSNELSTAPAKPVSKSRKQICRIYIL